MADKYYFTQAHNVDISKTIIDIVIGFDFGTSCSKIVFRSPLFGNKRAVPIDFGKMGHSKNSHLLPTRPYFDENQLIRFDHSLTHSIFPALKMRLIEKPNEIVPGIESKNFTYTNFELAVGYLAAALRLSRKWFFENQSEIYGTAPIRWHYNIGIPSTGHKNEVSLRLFHLLAKASWSASILPSNDLKLSDCQKCISDVTKGINPLEILNDQINVVPEVSAQVVGYISSTLRRDGLHLLIDIGAGTVDICCFRLDGDGHKLLGSSVERLGAFELHTIRIQEMKDRVIEWLRKYGLREDPIEPIPESPKHYLPELTNADILKGFDGDVKIRTHIFRELYKVLHYVKRIKDPNSPNWTTGITTFFTGGGSKVPIYDQALSESDQWWKANARIYGLRKIELDIPDSIVSKNMSKAEYHRVSVAYGLSHTIDELGEIIPEFEIKDVILPKNEMDRLDNFISKDQM